MRTAYTIGLLLAWGLGATGSPAAAAPLPGAEPLSGELAAKLEGARLRAGAEPRTRHRDPKGRPIYVNRLALESSPYLLQHAFNPVNWYPWGNEAFATARRLGRPVLLSIGYSTCHWCHVMEEESFEDPEIAEFLNSHYVAVKVDREERPDVDALYMTALRGMTGHGGWPMTVFTTAEREPFFAGTYFPPRDDPAIGRPGLLTVLRRLSALYGADPERVAHHAKEISRALAQFLAPEPAVGTLGGREILRALADYRKSFDPEYGGLGTSTKFPSTLPASLLLRVQRRTGDGELGAMVTRTLDAMRRGGIYDHVAGGFHRYAVERTWSVPHFEKMLYDNALLTRVYLEAWQATGDSAYAEVVRDVLAYVARELTSPLGTFYSATDADSEGEEGRFFVWTREELQEVLNEDHAFLALAAYGLEGPPNFEGKHWVLRRDRELGELASALGLSLGEVSTALQEIRSRLYEKRVQRVPPLRDDKQLVSWNGLMIGAFARAGLALREPELVERASRAAGALLEHARPGGRLARYLKDDEPQGTGLLDDHAFLISSLLDLFEASGEPRWLRAATELQLAQDRRFLDEEAGGYWISPSDGERLLARAKPARDGARPGANAVAAENLLRLYYLRGDESYRVRAEMTVRAFSDWVRREPSAFARLLEALDLLLDTPKEILIVTPAKQAAEAEPFLSELGREYLPNRVLCVASEDRLEELRALVPLLEGKRPLHGEVTAYVCENRVCQLPTGDPALFARQIAAPAEPYPD